MNSVHDHAERATAVRRGRLLEYLTIGWNLLEGIISISAGLLAGSIALIGFGFDSLIEVSSGAALLWRLHMDAPERRERAEAIALKLVGISFILLAIYVAVDAVKSLIQRELPEPSYLGIAIAALSLVVMPYLASAKRRVAAVIQSRALQADSRQTDICAYLSAILLGGLLLNALFGWWWADPVAALVMVPIIAREGIEALRGESCCGQESDRSHRQRCGDHRRDSLT
jgi:divalent metal cation (Fe/Co/Zn/Cd) transporter